MKKMFIVLLFGFFCFNFLYSYQITDQDKEIVLVLTKRVEKLIDTKGEKYREPFSAVLLKYHDQNIDLKPRISTIFKIIAFNISKDNIEEELDKVLESQLNQKTKFETEYGSFFVNMFDSSYETRLESDESKKYVIYFGKVNDCMEGEYRCEKYMNKIFVEEKMPKKQVLKEIDESGLIVLDPFEKNLGKYTALVWAEGGYGIYVHMVVFGENANYHFWSSNVIENKENDAIDFLQKYAKTLEE